MPWKLNKFPRSDTSSPRIFEMSCSLSKINWQHWRFKCPRSARNSSNSARTRKSYSRRYTFLFDFNTDLYSRELIHRWVISWRRVVYEATRRFRGEFWVRGNGDSGLSSGALGTRIQRRNLAWGNWWKFYCNMAGCNV